MPNSFQRGQPPQIGRIHRSHAVGGANGTTMVVMFVHCCVGCYGTVGTIPTVGILRGGSFDPVRTLIAVKLFNTAKIDPWPLQDVSVKAQTQNGYSGRWGSALPSAAWIDPLLPPTMTTMTLCHHSSPPFPLTCRYLSSGCSCQRY